MSTLVSITISILVSGYSGDNEKFLNKTIQAYEKIIGKESSCEVSIEDNSHEVFRTLVTEQGTGIVRKPNAVTRMTSKSVIFNRQWLSKKETTPNEIIKVLFHEMGHCEFNLPHGKNGTVMDNNLSTAKKDVVDLIMQFLEEVSNKGK